jgi:hypothetical protein
MPAMAIFVTDDWQWAPRIEDLGCLVIRAVAGRDWACDWSALRNLWVILAQWRMPLSRDSRLASALLAAEPSRLETFDGKRLRVVL